MLKHHVHKIFYFRKLSLEVIPTTFAQKLNKQSTSKYCMYVIDLRPTKKVHVTLLGASVVNRGIFSPCDLKI